MDPGSARSKKGCIMMEKEIKWETMMDEAMSRVHSENKPMLLECYDTGCIGCQQMDKVTFRNAEVIKFVEDNVIPMRVRFDNKLITTMFNIHWTPTFLLLDSEQMEHHRLVGFLAAHEFVPALMLGIDKMYFDNDQLDNALTNLDKLLSDYPESDSAPEAIYLRGVTMFKSTHDPGQLREAHKKLIHDYPKSEWTKRSDPYRLL